MRRKFTKIKSDNSVELKYHSQFFVSCLRAIEGKNEFYERKNAIAGLIEGIVEAGEQVRDFTKDDFIVEGIELQSFLAGIPAGSYGYMKQTAYAMSLEGFCAMKTQNGPTLYRNGRFVNPKTIASVIDIFRKNKRAKGPLAKGHRLFGELVVDRVFSFRNDSRWAKSDITIGVSGEIDNTVINIFFPLNIESYDKYFVHMGYSATYTEREKEDFIGELRDHIYSTGSLPKPATIVDNSIIVSCTVRKAKHDPFYGHSHSVKVLSFDKLKEEDRKVEMSNCLFEKSQFF